MFILLDHFLKKHSGYFDDAGHVFEAYKWSAGKANVNEHMEASSNRFQSSDLSTTTKA